MGVAGFAIVDFRVWRSGSRLVVASLTALRLGFGMGFGLCSGSCLNRFCRASAVLLLGSGGFRFWQFRGLKHWTRAM